MHKHERGQKGKGHGQSQSMCISPFSSVEIAPSAISRHARIDNPLNTHVPELTTRDVPMLISVCSSFDDDD